MQNQAAFLERIGRHFNDGKIKGTADRLAGLLNTTPASVRNWRRPETDEQHRKMPGPAIRLLLLLYVLEAVGQPADDLIATVETLEELLADSNELGTRLQQVQDMF